MAKADAGGPGGMSFEAALHELEEIVQRLESGEVPLEESVKIYERGAALREHCEAKLNAARQRVEVLAGGISDSGEAGGRPIGRSPKDDDIPFDDDDDDPPF